MLIAAPAFAQDVPKPAESQPAEAQSAQDVPAAPATTAESATDQAAQPAATPPADSTAATAPEATAPAAQPATSQEQVAQAVGRDFGTYDTDADGTLNATEFAAWMGTLRKAAEPTFAPDSPEAKSWADQAFNSADADKSASVNKQELTAFLTPKSS
ncbi:EF-hand domain-containing protein [Sphingomonas soli]|uniref:EF-hand domain-containing protein n=1 Tax=Sphingomonas soli TaxID=266127 RepID=UPI000835BDCD|nr:EF-hand domain-containing protein [Sphingomonas soli]